MAASRAGLSRGLPCSAFSPRSAPGSQRELRQCGIVTRRRTLSSGRTTGWVPLTNGPLAHILRNRLYVGELYHKGASYAGEHAPIVAPALFDAVQERLTSNRNGARVKRAASGALLIGRIFDDRDRIAALCRSVEKDVLISSAFGEAARPKDRARLV